MDEIEKNNGEIIIYRTEDGRTHAAIGVHTLPGPQVGALLGFGHRIIRQAFGVDQHDLDRLPPEWIAATCRTAAGCASLVHPRVSVLRALPGVVCDPASIDDIIRLTSKEG